MKIKQMSLACVAALTLSISTLSASGIPVVDGAQISQSQINHIEDVLKQAKTWAEEAKRWADTAAHYKEQLNAYARQLASQTGIRDVSSYLEDVKELYGSVNKLGMSITDAIEMTKDIKGFSKADFIRNFMDIIDNHYEYNPCKAIAEPKKLREMLA